jgi:hypothetical protein
VKWAALTKDFSITKACSNGSDGEGDQTAGLATMQPAPNSAVGARIESSITTRAEVEKRPLALSESTNVHDVLRLDAHTVKGRLVGATGETMRSPE